MTPKGQMSGNNAQPAMASLPQHIKQMFEARPPIPFLRPPKPKKMQTMTGVGALLKEFETTPAPPRPPFVTHKEQKALKRTKKIAAHEELLKEKAEIWDPHKNAKATEDPYKTLFVARISFDTTEKKLKREFEQFGPVKSIRMVVDEDNKPRGYAFVEFEREQDMKTAYKRADGRKIDGRRVLVDVERGRTVKGWKPRKLGGGLGGTRKAPGEQGAEPPVKTTSYSDSGSRRDDSSRGGMSVDSRERRRSRSRERDSGSRREDDRYGPARGRSRDRDSYGGGEKRRRSRSRSADRKRERR